MKNRICEICGTEYTPKAPNAKYCSDECKAEGKRRKMKGYYQANKFRFKKSGRGLSNRICDFCGNEFKPKCWRQRFCTDECAENSISATRKFTDCTLTFIAGCLLDGYTLKQISQFGKWDPKTFIEEYKKYKQDIERRVKAIRSNRNSQQMTALINR